jgi:hypothetical protein
MPVEDGGRHDVVVFQKVYGDRYASLAREARSLGTRIVYDMCDNHLEIAPADDAGLAARRADVLAMIEVADAITVATTALADIVGPLAGDRPIHVVDDAVDPAPISAVGLRLRRWQRRRRRGRRGSPIRLAWFGSAGTPNVDYGVPHLVDIVPDLERVAASRAVKLTVISDNPKYAARELKPAALDVTQVEWSWRGFASTLAAHDAAILPIRRNPITDVKSGNRVIASLRLGVPVIADRIPAYDEFAPWIRFGQWERHVSELADDYDGVLDRTRAGAAYIGRTYTEAHLVQQWAQVLSSVAALGR